MAACEMQPVIAGLAQAVITANDMTSQVEVWAMKSTDLKVGQELPARAEVLVTAVGAVEGDGAFAHDAASSTCSPRRSASSARAAQVANDSSASRSAR